MLMIPLISFNKSLSPTLHHPYTNNMPSAQNPIVFLDIMVGGSAAGRIKIELYADKCPKTSENFRQFCTGMRGFSVSSPLTLFLRLLDITL